MDSAGGTGGRRTLSYGRLDGSGSAGTVSPGVVTCIRVEPSAPRGPYPPTQHYARAPITEAVIELRCQLQGRDIKQLAGIEDLVGDRYLRTEELHEWQAEIGQQGYRSDPPKVVGYKFVSRDGRQVFQARLDGFAFSWLAPYDRWETLREAARDVWAAYSATARPSRINRVGVRFINRIDIPLDAKQSVDLDDYFRTAPRIAPEIPQSMTSYFMRLQVPVTGPDALAIIIETGVPPPGSGLTSTVLDIDVVVENQTFDEAAAWDTINSLRYHKNGIFESCITDKLRGLIS
jgi:uncharacterized protein (TIGR04255 family)